MTNAYRAVGWNRFKRRYDLVALFGVALYLGVFFVTSVGDHPYATAEALLIRGLGSAAFVLLHVTLAIGPACRLQPRLLPLLYNRRHLGVTMFVLALGHGALSLLLYHTQSDVNPIVSLFASNTHYGDLARFPFQTLGFFALGILTLMAATSHDFWLANLSAPTWKALHMLVYVAYGLLVMHVALGVLQAEQAMVQTLLVGAGFVGLVVLHLVAGLREAPTDRELGGPSDGLVDVIAFDELPDDGRGHVACVSGERVAIFRRGDDVFALSNACQHQNGPLGEGRLIGDCVVCPWHGYEYDRNTGASPPPFTEAVPTFNVEVRDGRVLVNPVPHPARVPER